MFPIYLFSKFPFSTTNSHLERTKTYLVYVENNVLKFAAEHFEGISSGTETQEKFTCVLEYNIYT